MLAVIAVVAALGLAYFWLMNQWFARAIVFALLGAVFGLIFAEVALETLNVGYNPPLALALIACGWLFSWPVSRIPLYRHRRRARQNAAVRTMIVKAS